jgi:hypothetical protein
MESVKKVLNEGKKVNNNPYFDEYYSGNGGPKGRKIKPGEKIYNGLNPDGSDSSSDWDLKGNHRQNGGLSNQEFMDIAKKIPEKDGYKSPYFKQSIDDFPIHLVLRSAGCGDSIGTVPLPIPKA